MIKKRILEIINYIIFLFTLMLVFLSIYIDTKFNNISFEQLLYNLKNSQGSSSDIILSGLIYVGLCCIIVIIFLIIINALLKKMKYSFFLIINIKKKKILIDVFKVTILKMFFINAVFIICSSFLIIKTLGIDEYIISQSSSSKIFENYYVDTKNVKLEFPKDKQNLIHIYVESLEMTSASLKNGGALTESFIPNLESLALSNINFSNDDDLGGALQVYGAGYTAASMIAQTAGVPLKVSIDGNSYQGYGDSLPGVYNLGDILRDNGYKNYLMFGSNAEFGGRKDYFSYHGNYDIYDYVYAKATGLIDPNYYVWWGYEDKKLYSFAKEKLLEISEKDEPFNFTMLTADTHFYDGYFDSSCPAPFDKQYANVFNCSDTMLSNFINWILKQDFSKNTTIIISGDHFTMQDGFYDDLIASDYDRNIYNAFINSRTTPTNPKNRLFSSFDMFPTTLGALGVKIEGNKLGLGTNLFSDESTIIENLGFDYLNTELRKKSFYYDNSILKDTYYKMQEVNNE